MKRKTWVLVLEVETDEIRVVSVDAGVRPKADSDYKCHGPYKSKIAACRAVDEKSSVLTAVFYGNGRQYVDEGNKHQ